MTTTRSQRFAQFVNNLAAMPETVSHRWRSGECAAFAVALAEVVNKVFDVPKEAMEVYVGARWGMNEDTHRRRTTFSHAVLSIKGIAAPDRFSVIDCFGDDAMNKWEAGFSEQEWSLPKYQKSSFDWTPVPVNIPAINKQVRSIDHTPMMQMDSVREAFSMIVEYGNVADCFDCREETEQELETCQP